jgi:hypothetical protein
MASYGIPQDAIAKVLGVTGPTLRRHCASELATGAARTITKVADFLYVGIVGSEAVPPIADDRARVTAAIFFLKTRGGWSETSIHKHTGAIDIEFKNAEDELDRKIARLAPPSGAAEIPPEPD